VPPVDRRRIEPVIVVALACVVAGLWGIQRAAAQDLSPRFYWPAPSGTKVAVLGYSYVSGDLLMDPSLPVSGADSSVSTAIGAYLHAIGLFGRTANVVVEVPYSWGTTKGLLFDQPARRDFSAVGDLCVTPAVNLIGAPTLSPSDFQRSRASPRPILGVSLKVLAPTGHYDADRLINVGANRWAAKPEVGFLIPLTSRWLLEFEAGVWLLGDDDRFLPGRRKQQPIYSGEAHLVRRLRPGCWASLEANLFAGGRQTIGENPLADPQRNSRVGGAVVVPFRGRHAIKAGCRTGVVTRFGSDFDQVLVSHQILIK
jgi:hypothetical protein